MEFTCRWSLSDEDTSQSSTRKVDLCLSVCSVCLREFHLQHSEATESLGSWFMKHFLPMQWFEKLFTSWYLTPLPSPLLLPLNLNYLLLLKAWIFIHALKVTHVFTCILSALWHGPGRVRYQGLWGGGGGGGGHVKTSTRHCYFTKHESSHKTSRKVLKTDLNMLKITFFRCFLDSF